jgi:superfamily II DNA or RNA helicase
MSKIKLIVDNVYTAVEGASKDTEFAIWNELSFQIQEYQEEHTRRRHLYNRKTKKTYTGLIDYVIRILDELGEDYEIEDNRVAHLPNADFKLVDKIQVGPNKWVPLDFRPYQQEIVDRATERECIQAATGAGKTFMMAALIAKFNVKPVAIFADKLSLCTQIKEEFEKFLGVPVGIVGGGINQKEDITVYSIQSATPEDVKDAKMIMFDECHHLPAATMNDIARNCKNAYYRIGVSATPWRDGGDDLLIEAVLRKRKPEFSINASKLIQLGYLVPATIYFVPMKQVVKGKNYHDVYNKAIADNKERNDAILKIALQMYKRQKTQLILIQRVEHGKTLFNMLASKIPLKAFTVNVEDPKNGKMTAVRVKNIEFLSGQDEALRRKAVIQAVKEKKCQILIGSTIADEGLDIPSLDCLILAGGGKSSTRAFQRIGRVLRLFDGKDRAICFDFVDYTPMLRRHSRIREKLYRTEEEWEIKFLNPSLLKDE